LQILTSIPRIVEEQQGNWRWARAAYVPHAEVKVILPCWHQIDEHICPHPGDEEGNRGRGRAPPYPDAMCRTSWQSLLAATITNDILYLAISLCERTNYSPLPPRKPLNERTASSRTSPKAGLRQWCTCSCRTSRLTPTDFRPTATDLPGRPTEHLLYLGVVHLC